MDRRWHLGAIYGVIVSLMLIMGVWWFYYFSQEGSALAEVQLQKLANDRLHATFLLRTDPAIRADPEGQLGTDFPGLRFRRDTSGDVTAVIDPVVVDRVRAEARQRRNMILWEGLFILALLGAAATILVLALRREREFKRARALFLAGATHEFKTPLASLRLYAETLNRPELPEVDRSRIRVHMVEDIKKLEGLVNQILALSGDDAFREEPRRRLDLALECRTVLADLQSYVEGRDARVNAVLPEGHFVRGQNLALGLILRNLVQNAVKFSPAPARVDITLERRGDWHRLSVADEGLGIPRRLHAKVFECFYSRSENEAGAGLGLYLVQRCADRLGGRVELVSDEGRGATFTVLLPVYEGESP